MEANISMRLSSRVPVPVPVPVDTGYEKGYNNHRKERQMQKDFTCLNVPKGAVVAAKELGKVMGGFKQYFCVAKAIDFALKHPAAFRKFCYGLPHDELMGEEANED